MATKTAGETTLASDAAEVIFDNAVDGVIHKTVKVVNDPASTGNVSIVYTVRRNGLANQPDMKAGDAIILDPTEEHLLFDQSGHHGYVDKITATREAGTSVTLRFGPGA